MGFSDDVKIAAGFRRILPGEKFSATFHRLEVYQIFGVTLVESPSHVQDFNLWGHKFRLSIGSSINEICQKLHGDDVADDETSWAKEHEAAPPYLLVSFGPTQEYSIEEGFVRIDGDEIHFWDCFPNARKMLRDESDRAMPVLLTSLSVKFASVQAQSRFVRRDIAFFGADSSGRNVKDFRITVSARGMVSQAYTGDVIDGLVQGALESLNDVHKKVSEFFSWAESEDDNIKKFILYFISLEILIHSEFQLKFGQRTAVALENMASSHTGNFPISTRWLLRRKHRDWATLQERFIAGVMFSWTNLDDKDVEKFGQLKKMRDDFLHGSTSNLAEQHAGEVRAIVMKVLSAP